LVQKVPKLLAPIMRFEGAVKVIGAGADELYCDVEMPLKHFSLYRGAEHSIPTYKELNATVKYAHDHGVKVFITANMPFTADIIEKDWREHIVRCLEQNVDALVVGDLGVLSTIRDIDPGVPLLASTYFCSMNREAANFLKKLGFRRVILERHLTIPEISGIVENSEPEVEVFVHGAGCSNINVNCYLFHYRYPPLTKALRDVDGFKNPCTLPFEIYDSRSNEKLGEAPILDAFTFCSICHLPALVKAGVAGLKIVGRGDFIAFQESTTRIYRELLDLIGQDRVDEFYKKVLELKKDFLPRPPMFANLEEVACEQKRCFYGPLFHAPYRTQLSWSAWLKYQFKVLEHRK